MSQSSARFRTLAGFDGGPQAPKPLKDDRYDVLAMLNALWDARVLIVLATLLGAAVGYALTFVVDKTYEARATVFVTPPTFASELTPQPFSIEAFERLAQSEYIRNRVVSELRTQGKLEPTESPSHFQTVLYPSREPQKPFLPLIELHVQAKSPELAQSTANMWAVIFVDEQAKLATLGKAGSVDFILNEFPKASQKVMETERALKTQETTLDQEYARLRSSGAVDAKKTRLEALEELAVRLEGDLVLTRVDVKQARERLAAIEAELKTTPRVISLVKGPSDEAMWNAAARGAEGSAAGGSLAKLSIRTEEVNPVHVALSQQLADERVVVGSTTAREQSLTQQLAEVRRSAAALRTDYFQSEHQMLAMDRDHTVQLAARQMDLAEAKARFTKLEEKIGDAQIAKADSDSDVKVGAQAELPSGPIGPDVKKYVGGAGLLAFISSVALTLLLGMLGVIRPSRAPIAAQTAAVE